MPVDLPWPRVIVRTDDWVLQEGRYGPRMVLTARWSEAAARAWASRGARELELNYAKGWERGDLGFLTELPGLRALSLTDRVLDDASVVNELASLRCLELNTYSGTELRFDRLPHLEDCALEWRPRARSLFRHPGVKKLFLIESTNVADGDLSTLLDLPHLDHVSFMDRPHYSHTSADFPELSTEEGAWWRWRARRELEERLFGATVVCEGVS